MINGASVKELLSDAFEEVVCVRWAIFAFIAAAFAAIISCIVLACRGLWALYDCYQRTGAVEWSLSSWVLLPIAFGIVACFIGLGILEWVKGANTTGPR